MMKYKQFSVDAYFKRKIKFKLKKSLYQRAYISNKDNYNFYIQSDQWKLKRIEALERSNYQCEECGNKEFLEVHHLSYNHLGSERLYELRVLCKFCHAATHGRWQNIISIPKPKNMSEKKYIFLTIKSFFNSHPFISICVIIYILSVIQNMIE